MPVLSAKPLTEDPDGCSRLRAVIATDPGYAERAEEAASGRVEPYRTKAAAALSSRLQGPDCQGDLSCGSVTGVLPQPQSWADMQAATRLAALSSAVATAVAGSILGLSPGAPTV